ncbi:hypothetical protein EV385_3125 [Krasilnikovia cinnamomea]|uniref:Lipoprotein n=1 Tax=Krasilnikovia cinnamomea TaxID=349313 RepID=A0A4Q7ZL55_9ACTN|nr:hypothetical protein [Krasilnikovia cinnamomea]RZU51311.1 hypothetical protein EV385_3125 [Krasilnikovia cinnamomea]
MLRPSRSSLLTATVALGAGLFALPGPAYAADTTTSLDAATMAVELKTVADASTAAAHDGWKMIDTFSAGSMSGSSSVVVDLTHRIAYTRSRYGTEGYAMYVVGGKGVYQSLSGPDERAAVKMMGRPEVRYQFNAMPSMTLDDYLMGGAQNPAAALTDSKYAGTKTVHDDGSTDYGYHDDKDMTITLHVSAAGTLTSSRGTGNGFTDITSYTYGAQHVTLPAASVTISSTTLFKGVAYVNMKTTVAEVASQGAADTRRAAHGHRIKVATLRKIVRRDVADFNRGTSTKMIKVTVVKRGVRLRATNPWTHKSVTFTVKAYGKKIAVKG